MKIVRVTKKDVPKVLEFSKEFIVEYRKARKMKTKVSVETALRYKKEYFEKTLESKNGTIFLAEKGKNRIGYIFVILFVPGMENAKRYSPGYISDLHINKNYRGRGYGTKLVKEAERWLRKQGKKDLALDVSISNKGAIRLYKRMKFEEKSIRFEKKL